MAKDLTCGKYVAAKVGNRCTNCRNGDSADLNKKIKNDSRPSLPSPSCSYENSSDGSSAEQISPENTSPPRVDIARELTILT